MAFSEALKQQVKKQSNFTCCFCNDRAKRVDIHHIVPQAEGGPDTIENAAPLCGSCHDMYGANPELRKEIRQRRDAWYEKCLEKPEMLWPVGVDVPLLEHFRDLPAARGTPTPGFQLIDKVPSGQSGPPLLYISIHFKKTRYFIDHVPDSDEKWLYVQADMRPALNVRIQVQATNSRDVEEIVGVLETNKGGYNLQGPNPDNNPRHAGDYLYIWREDDECRFMMSTFTATNAGVSVHARLSEETAKALADYLRKSGFVAG